ASQYRPRALLLAKTGLVRGRRQRTRRQPGPRLALVVRPRRDVVRRNRMEEGRQVLDLAAPRPKLEHPAAVQPDLVRLAVGVEVEQLAEKTEARRLDVQGERREGEALDVVDRVNRRVPGDSVAVWPQDLLRL